MFFENYFIYFTNYLYIPLPISISVLVDIDDFDDFEIQNVYDRGGLKGGKVPVPSLCSKRLVVIKGISEA